MKEDKYSHSTTLRVVRRNDNDLTIERDAQRGRIQFRRARFVPITYRSKALTVQTLVSIVQHSLETDGFDGVSPLLENGKRVVRRVALIRRMRGHDEEQSLTSVLQHQPRPSNHITALFRRRHVAQNETKHERIDAVRFDCEQPPKARTLRRLRNLPVKLAHAHSQPIALEHGRHGWT